MYCNITSQQQLLEPVPHKCNLSSYCPIQQGLTSSCLSTHDRIAGMQVQHIMMAIRSTVEMQCAVLVLTTGMQCHNPRPLSSAVYLSYVCLSEHIAHVIQKYCSLFMNTKHDNSSLINTSSIIPYIIHVVFLLFPILIFIFNLFRAGTIQLKTNGGGRAE
jgi:hypothetical protein